MVNLHIACVSLFECFPVGNRTATTTTSPVRHILTNEKQGGIELGYQIQICGDVLALLIYDHAAAELLL